jgi:hypothetical protein
MHGAKIKKNGTRTILVEVSEDEEALGTHDRRGGYDTKMCLNERV